ncbi:MAG: rhodanese-like domain-containing protein [Terracidiphilus sp.]
MLWLTEFWNSKIAKALGAVGWESRVELIDASSLASLSNHARGNLILLDVRDPHEIEKYSYSIQGALLTMHVDVSGLVQWIPRKSTVVLFAAETIPLNDARLHLPAQGLKVHALDGGLQAWCQAGLPLEPVVLSDRRWVDNP